MLKGEKSVVYVAVLYSGERYLTEDAFIMNLHERYHGIRAFPFPRMLAYAYAVAIQKAFQPPFPQVSTVHHVAATAIQKLPVITLVHMLALLPQRFDYYEYLLLSS
jgi:hypothetical protein